MTIPRKYIGLILALVFLCVNGNVFSPLSAGKPGHRNGTSSAGQCCCADHHDDTSCPCCQEAGRSTSHEHNGCSFSAASCSSPVLAVSPNMLDPAIEMLFTLNTLIPLAEPKNNSTGILTLLSGIRSPLFHPPQPSLCLS